MTKIDKGIISELMHLKFDLEDQNIRDYQKIQELKRSRLSNVHKIDDTENRLRELFDKEKIKRKELK